MKYIRTKDGRIIEPINGNVFDQYGEKWVLIGGDELAINMRNVINQSDIIDELCDCFIKIKRKSGCRDYILKFDFKDLPLLKQQRIKYPTSPVYGAIHIEDKGLIYVAKMNEKGEFNLL